MEGCYRSTLQNIFQQSCETVSLWSKFLSAQMSWQCKMEARENSVPKGPAAQ